MFSPLPTSMPRLKEAVRLMDEVAIQSPPSILKIGERLRLEYRRASASSYENLSQSQLRQLPYAYWLAESPCLQEEHQQLADLYWDKYLIAALQSSPRRAKRWLTPLFFTYCENFNPADPYFRDYASRLLRALPVSMGMLADKLRTLQNDYKFFSPDEVSSNLAKLFFLDHAKTLDDSMTNLMLWPGFASTNLGRSTLKSGLGLRAEDLKSHQTIARLFDWGRLLNAPIVKTSLRIEFADALLRPWGRQKPADGTKRLLVDFFVSGYGDPRLAGHKNFQWQGVSPQAVGALLYWLTGDTLRGFMTILQRTADDIWMYRQKFWMAYYDKGFIDEAWLALGQNALEQARHSLVDQKGMGYGRLDGGAALNQSVLFLKIGDLIFTEWSHNGTLRAYRQGMKNTPLLYQNSYHGVDLRAAESMDFHEGLNVNPGLVHSHSDKGTWQRKARDFIRSHTGVSMNDRDIL